MVGSSIGMNGKTNHVLPGHSPQKFEQAIVPLYTHYMQWCICQEAQGDSGESQEDCGGDSVRPYCPQGLLHSKTKKPQGNIPARSVRGGEGGGSIVQQTTPT